MPKRYWYVIITYIIMQLSGYIVIPLYYITHINPNTLTVYWSIFSFLIGILITLRLLRPDIRTGIRENAAPWGKTIIWVIVGLFFSLFFQNIAGWIETDLLGIDQGSENTQQILDVTQANPIFTLIPILFAPILEELIFRKIIFGQLYRKMNFFLAALLSALIFALIHMEPQHVLIYASMGFVFAYIYVRTKRIIASILVHMSMNSFAILVPLLTPQDKLDEMMNQTINLFLNIFGGL